MPLPSTPQPDLIVWRGDMTGNYSIKLGNNVLMRGLASTHSSYPTMPPSSLSGLYNKIWNANVPSKVRITVWRFVRNYILTFDNLSFRGIVAHTSCLLCDRYSETASHLISTCAFSRRIFSTLNITLPQVSPISEWLPCAGDVLAAGCFSHPLVLDSFEAEALACYQALVLAHDLSYRRIVIEGDSLSVIKKVQNFSEDRSVIGMLIKDIKRKMGNFDSTTAPFCPRACNKPAHFLAHLGRSLPTPCIWTECSTPS
ncbi:hypothetical protein V6N12_007027 [Hibiscus sabdariffa]|uniref:Reverse transcriptase zinc-binding domain-containing protein n=1 Tax=Hibiscus sabdariffa TaxID=183260 RepID=A0ABR2F0J3_9ROSI